MHPTSANLPHRRPPRHHLVAVAALLAVFAALATLVAVGWRPLVTADRSVDDHVHTALTGRPWLVRTAADVTILGNTVTLVTVAALGLIALLVARRWRLAAFVAVAYGLAAIANPLIKALVGRHRPAFDHGFVQVAGQSFPSGHSMGSITCYGALLVAVLCGWTLPPTARAVLVAAVALLVTAVGVSRVMLGAHYPSDVLGAWCLGAAWLAVAGYAFRLRPAGREPAAGSL